MDFFFITILFILKKMGHYAWCSNYHIFYNNWAILRKLIGQEP